MKRTTLYLFLFFCLIHVSTYGQSGIITTICGNGIGTGTPFGSFSGDGGPATAAGLDYPRDIALDSKGNIYFADYDNVRIRKIDRSGIITTYAGNGVKGYSGDGGPATTASFYYPSGIAIDRYDNLYISDGANDVVRKVSNAGIISTFAGKGKCISTSCFSGDGGPATAAAFDHISDVAVDTFGNVFVVDGSNHCIRKVDRYGIISTYAGNHMGGSSTPGATGDGGPATAAEINSPYHLTTDLTGNLYVTSNCACIRKVNTLGTISTIAGTIDVSGFAGDGGPATVALLWGGGDITTDVAGNIYFFEDGSNPRIREINTSGIISTVVGNGTRGFSGDGGPATAAEIWGGGIAADCGGNIYIGDGNNQRVRVSATNNSPYFIYGASHHIAVCNTGIATGIDSILLAADPDTLTTISWRIGAAPLHGTLLASYSAITNRDTLTPMGITYTPATGFSGTDTFTVSVAYCGALSAAITIYADVSLPPVAGSITGPAAACAGWPNNYHNTATGGTWSSTNTASLITSAGVYYPYTIGTDTILYTVTNFCGSSTAKLPVEIIFCPDGVPSVPGGYSNLTISPNPTRDRFNARLASLSTEPCRLVLTDITGRKIKEISTFTNQDTEVSVDAPPGIYIITAYTATGVYTGKLLRDR